MPEKTMLVRLKPYNPKRGYKVRRFILSSLKVRLEVEKGWYEVPASVAEVLSKKRQDPQDPESAELCDVCTREQAIALEEREKAAEERASARAPHTGDRRVHAPTRRNASAEAGDLTTADLAKNQPEPSVAGSRRAKPAPASSPRKPPVEVEEPEMLDPDPDGEELAGQDEIAPVGRLTTPAPKGRSRKRSK